LGGVTLFIVTLLNLAQDWNAYEPMLVTDAGISMPAKLAHPQNAYVPTLLQALPYSKITVFISG
jgi:hypothetical protein